MRKMIVVQYRVIDPTHREMDRILNITIMDDNPTLPEGLIGAIMAQISSEVNKALKGKYLISAMRVEMKEGSA